MTSFEDKQARKGMELHDKLQIADEALKKAIEERVKLGAEAARQELYDFATWVPGRFPSNWNAIMGRRMTASEHAECRDAPFLSETYLYYLMGKDEARTVMALFDSVCRALGIEDGYRELQEPWWQAKEAARKKQIDGLVHRRECAIGEGHTLSAKPCDVCKGRRDRWKADHEKATRKKASPDGFVYDPKESFDLRHNLERIRDLMDEDEWKQFKKRKEFQKPKKKAAKIAGG